MSSAKTAGAPLGSPAYLPELPSPCLVIYVCVLIFSTSFEDRKRLTHLCIADTSERGRAGEASLPVQGIWKEVASLGHGQAA